MPLLATRKPVPQTFLPDGQGHVAVLTQITGTRPDGRTLDDTQILLFTLTDGLVASVDQFIGDPAVVTASGPDDPRRRGRAAATTR